MLPAELAGRTLARGAPPKAAGVRLEEERQGHWLVDVERPRPAERRRRAEAPGLGGAAACQLGLGHGTRPIYAAAESVASRQGPEEGQGELGHQEPKRSCRPRRPRSCFVTFNPSLNLPDSVSFSGTREKIFTRTSP